MAPIRVCILGGGLAGLVAGWMFARQGLPYVILEAGDQAGGKVRSIAQNGFLIELGPNSLQRRTPTFDTLIDDLGLSDEILLAHPSAKKRFIVRENRLCALPTSPIGLFRSKALSRLAAFQVLAEPFKRPNRPAGEESLSNLVRRRLGDEWLTYAADPFTSGIYAGDPDVLSVRLAFPRLYEAEQEAGSLLKGFLRLRNSSNVKRVSFSFKEGLRSLSKALFKVSANALKVNHTVTAVTRAEEQWEVHIEQTASPITCSHVLSTLPLTPLNSNVFRIGTQDPFHLEASYPPVTVIALGYRKKQVQHPLDGFGFLVPSIEHQYGLLGCIFNSSLFPNRAPEGHVLLTCLVGGARHPSQARLPSEKLISSVHQNVASLLQITGEPVLTHEQRWPHAIPQYNLGYESVLNRLIQLEQQHKGLHFAGNYRHGVSVTDTIEGATAIARKIVGETA